ncbi:MULTISPECIES: acyl-CoA dehydrogenase family protein [Streptomyces]|uniref:Acyl-CoA dehydrogenase n=1 Tax=Streptomyces zinciresistens K42 TaxID=700597 RepID=G2GBA7_9ACTN|nr:MULTISPECIES: acyl-CoA dehydrogenase family protein [Streptomyces]EGX59203.1 acyl-CoA dehydrogenase [Streptomyces zinciresistens K42]MDT9695974.1 acyl-CoA dehydrogenase family protein [Streptomyces sp. P17]
MPTALSLPFLTDDHLSLLNEAEAFATSRLTALARQMEEGGPHTNRDVRQILSETGWLGLLIDTEDGGLNLGHTAKTLVLQAVSRVSPAAGATLQASILGSAPIAEYGSEEMRRKLLPEIAAGRCWPSIAVTDPERGSHILGLEATARPSGGQYILEGEKVLVGNAAIADVHCVVVRTGKPGDRHSLTAFLVEQDTPGVDIVPAPVNGLRGFSVDTLRLTRVCVPETNMIGELGDGLDVAQLASVVYGRLNLAAVALGIHQRMLDETTQRVSTRKRRDGHLADLPTVRHRVAEMQHHLMTAELAAYHAARLLDQGKACDPWLHNAKLTAHRAGAASSEHAKQLYGGHAARIGEPIEQLRRDFDLIHAPAGPDDLQLIRLAESVLGPHHPQWSAEHAVRRARRAPHAA